MYFLFKKNFWSKITPRTLIARFALIVIVPMLVSHILAIQAFYNRHWYNVSQQMSRAVASEIDLFYHNFIKIKHSELLSQLITTFGISYHLIPNTSIPKFKEPKREELKILYEEIYNLVKQPIVVKYDKDESKIIVYIQYKTDVLEMRLAAKKIMTPTTYVYIAWAAGIAVCLSLISLLFLRNQLRSIKELAEVADNFGRGIKQENYHPSGALEVRQAGFAFIKMRERIERHLMKRTQMLAMISHDLKTPLTRIKLQLAMMPQNTEIQEIEMDVHEMEHMIASYLDFARGEGGESYEKHNIAEFIQKNFTNKSGKIELITVNSKPKYFANIKPRTFKRALANIIENAQKYAKHCWITLYRQEDNIIIDIEDDGKGIKDEENELATRPFYRADSARNIDGSGSVGLGLAISKEIILGHNGTIQLLDSKKYKGLLVKIRLPAIKAKT